MDLKVFVGTFIDNFKIPYLTNFFGHRKAWLLIIQSFLGLSIFTLGYSNPSNYLEFTAICSLMVAFFSASQDIVVDAFRIEILDDNSQGAAAAMTQL